MNTKALMTSNRNDWETPWKLFDELNNEFHFTLDPCASDTNHKFEMKKQRDFFRKRVRIYSRACY